MMWGDIPSPIKLYFMDKAKKLARIMSSLYKLNEENYLDYNNCMFQIIIQELQFQKWLSQ